MKILIYSFGKFGGLKKNPAYFVAKLISKKIKKHQVLLIKLPTTYNCLKKLKKTFSNFKPSLIIGLGLDIGSKKLAIEKIALNYKHSEMPDNEKKVFILKKIDKKAPTAYETNFDVEKLSKILNKNGLKTRISIGSDYVCNYTYFGCLQYTKNHPTVKTVFIHLPMKIEELKLKNPKLAISEEKISNEIAKQLTK